MVTNEVNRVPKSDFSFVNYFFDQIKDRIACELYYQ